MPSFEELKLASKQKAIILKIPSQLNSYYLLNISTKCIFRFVILKNKENYSNFATNFHKRPRVPRSMPSLEELKLASKQKAIVFKILLVIEFLLATEHFCLILLLFCFS
jgi:hypothetical protein